MIPRTIKKRFPGAVSGMAEPLRCRLCGKILKTTTRFNQSSKNLCIVCLKGRKG